MLQICGTVASIEIRHDRADGTSSTQKCALLIEQNHAYLTGIVESGITELRGAIDRVLESVQALPEAIKSILEPLFNRIQAWLKRILLKGGYLQQVPPVQIKIPS